MSRAKTVVCPACSTAVPLSELTAYKPYDRKCEECGDYFDTAQPRARFCSNGCKNRAYNDRRRGSYVRKTPAPGEEWT